MGCSAVVIFPSEITTTTTTTKTSTIATTETPQGKTI